MQTAELNSRRNKMKRITLIALASAGLAFAATPSFAQSSYGGNTGQSYGNSSKSQSNANLRRQQRAVERAAKAERIRAEGLRAEAAELEAKKKAMAAEKAKIAKSYPSQQK